MNKTNKFMSPCLWTLPIVFHVAMYYNNTCKARERPFTKGSEAMEEGMTNAEFDAFLETLAQLIEAKAATVKEAAHLVRDKKSK